MPLRDHYHSPWRDEYHAEGFHSAWINTIVRDLNGTLLPPQYRAVPQVHLGAYVEADIATFEKNGNGFPETVQQETGTGTAVWAPPQPTQTIEVDFLNQDVYEVQVYDENCDSHLVGVVELVSPGNKDRPENVATFTSKCISYLQKQIGLVIVDIVTNRKVNLHNELVERLRLKPSEIDAAELYAVSYRTLPENNHWRLDTWPIALTIGGQLPIAPLWLSGEFAVPLDLEKTYEETSKVLRIR